MRVKQDRWGRWEKIRLRFGFVLMSRKQSLLNGGPSLLVVLDRTFQEQFAYLRMLFCSTSQLARLVAGVISEQKAIAVIGRYPGINPSAAESPSPEGQFALDLETPNILRAVAQLAYSGNGALVSRFRPIVT
jgi:hypothetical protein